MTDDVPAPAGGDAVPPFPTPRRIVVGVDGSFDSQRAVATAATLAAACGAEVVGVHAVGLMHAVKEFNPYKGVRLITYARDPDHPGQTLELDSRHESFPEFLAEHDVIVNCVLQDTEAPLTFVTNDELSLFRPGTLFVDVSADAGMGFEWARPTGFEEPILELGDGLSCYAVDHSPSLLWRSATWEISRALMRYLRALLAGPSAWEREETLRRAIEIRDGVVQNPKILSFQGRAEEYPHARL